MANEQQAIKKISSELDQFEIMVKELRNHMKETSKAKYPWCNLGSIAAANSHIMEALTLFDVKYEAILDKRQGRV